MDEKILMVVHQKTSVFGRVGEKLEKRGYHLERCCPPEGDELPSCLDGYAGTVIFGGPMSANDDLDGIQKELNWIPLVLESQTPFFGICLGAQLLAKSLGAKVYTHPEKLVEIGYYPIKSTDEGRYLFPESIHAYQWHREGSELPQGAVRLAGSDCYENQAFSYGKNVYGIQFHPEVSLGMMKRWLEKGAERLKLPGAQTSEEHTTGFEKYDQYVLQWLEDFLDHWLDTKAKEAFIA